MFERFTVRARRVVVHAQDEARGLQHNYIGTEHLLLGLLDEPDGIAGQVLARFGMSLPVTREEVIERVGAGRDARAGRIPFTPRAKKTLELALREALSLQHNYIGTEHLLLSVAREGDGAGASILAAHGADIAAIRAAVLDLLPAARTSPGHRWLRRAAGPAGELAEPEELQATPAAETSLAEAARLAGGHPVGSHHLLLATLADPDTAAARTLTALGVDLEQARQALRSADITGTSDEPPEEKGRRQMVSPRGGRHTHDRGGRSRPGQPRPRRGRCARRPGRGGRDHPRWPAGKREPRRCVAGPPRQPRRHPPPGGRSQPTGSRQGRRPLIARHVLLRS